jgi:hypothetical protein
LLADLTVSLSVLPFLPLMGVETRGNEQPEPVGLDAQGLGDLPSGGRVGDVVDASMAFFEPLVSA